MAPSQARSGWRRYVQSEVARSPGVSGRCFGSAVYGELRRLKAGLDPNGLFNRGSVFPVG